MVFRSPMFSNLVRSFFVAAFACTLTCPAAAQSIYVAGALGADISLASGSKTTGPIPGLTRGGESLSGAARLGVALDQRWGVELEVARSAETLQIFDPGIAWGFVGSAPVRAPEIETRSRVTTVSATGSVRHRVSDAVALWYLGGVVFHRTDRETRLRGGGFVRSGLFELPPLSRFPPGVDVITTHSAPFVLPSARAETVRYGAGPVVGLEAHIGYGNHFTFISGIRMLGLPASWLVRPAVGGGWRF
jgi:hypothetical protein